MHRCRECESEFSCLPTHPAPCRLYMVPFCPGCSNNAWRNFEANLITEQVLLLTGYDICVCGRCLLVGSNGRSQACTCGAASARQVTCRDCARIFRSQGALRCWTCAGGPPMPGITSTPNRPCPCNLCTGRTHVA